MMEATTIMDVEGGVELYKVICYIGHEKGVRQ